MKEIHSETELIAHLKKTGSLAGAVLQAFKVKDGIIPTDVPVSGAMFLGCDMSDTLICRLHHSGALVFPDMRSSFELPYDSYRTKLYNRYDLFDAYDPSPDTYCSYCETLDAKIYNHWRETGQAQPKTIQEALARRLHDLSITEALNDYLHGKDEDKRVVIMGGHSLLRNDPFYEKVARLSYRLNQKGYLMISGGGPGAMEATHLGAMLAGRDENDIPKAIKLMSHEDAIKYDGKLWLQKAYEVIDKFDDGSGKESLGIPTWLYGHEPPTPFASHIAKYFANSVREEGLVTLGIGGVIFSPGSAGTIQEIFQDAAQNHYVTTGKISPMIFLGRDYWRYEKPVYPALKLMASAKPYGKLVQLFDEIDDIINYLDRNKPLPGGKGPKIFCEVHCEE